MRILCLTANPPNPAGHGGAQRAAHIVRALGCLGEVHVVEVFRPAKATLGPMPGLAHFTLLPEPPSLVDRSARWQGQRLISPYLASALQGESWYTPRFTAADLSWIAPRLPLLKPDLVFACRISNAVLGDALRQAGLLSASRWLCDFDDIVSRVLDRQLAAGNLGGQASLALRLDRWRVRRAEARVLAAWDGVSICSASDSTLLAQQRHKAPPTVLPNVVDKDLLAAATGDDILFVGHLGYAPNVEGLEWFVRSVWSHVRAVRPDARLTIVGLQPSAAIAALDGRDGIHVHANVPSVDPYYARAALTIAPILTGGGTRIKILESFALGRAVVATSLGAEGLEAQDGAHLLLRDDPEGFGQAILTLLDDQAARSRITAAARAFQQAHYAPAAFDATLAGMVAP
jgi:polysaccharide biosynthesis protein PslH